MADSDDEILSPAELRSWLEGELAKVKRTAELRTQNATEFVAAYSKGELSPEEANGKLMEYYDRWGDTPLEGIGFRQQMTNKTVVERIDERRRESRRSRGL